MTLGVESLERRQCSAPERLELLLSKVESEARESVNSEPLGPENRPHQYTYKPNLNPEKDTVVVQEKVVVWAVRPLSQSRRQPGGNRRTRAGCSNWRRTNW